MVLFVITEENSFSCKRNLKKALDEHVHVVTEEIEFTLPNAT